MIERIVARLGLRERRGLGFQGGDRALATTFGRHHGQAIRIDSFEVDDRLILGPPPGSVKAPRRILATAGRCANKERCPRMETVVSGEARPGGECSDMSRRPSYSGSRNASSSIV